MNDTFSDDQQVLDALAADGHDLSSEMTIDFFLLATDEPAAHEMAEVLTKAGYQAEIECDEDGVRKPLVLAWRDRSERRGLRPGAPPRSGATNRSMDWPDQARFG